MEGLPQIPIEDDLYNIRQKLMQMENTLPRILEFLDQVNRKVETSNNKVMQLQAEINEIKQQLQNKK